MTEADFQTQQEKVRAYRDLQMKIKNLKQSLMELDSKDPVEVCIHHDLLHLCSPEELRAFMRVRVEAAIAFSEMEMAAL